MIIKEKALVVEKIHKAYDFEGKSGVSTKLRLLIGTDIFNVRSNEELNKSVQEGGEYLVSLEIKTRKEDPVFTVIEAVKTK